MYGVSFHYTHFTRCSSFINFIPFSAYSTNRNPTYRAFSFDSLLVSTKFYDIVSVITTEVN